ncbi:MAG: NADP-dependent phosphogluconate dehydrogenase [Bacteroidetes bacterium]|nr:NADP-dependent phosphogluconate dehydrogenase [Bacteroidota bacterium]
MNMQQYDFGMIGLGTMGQNLVLNIADHGYSVAGYDKDKQKVDNLNEQAADRKLKAFEDLATFIASLRPPRTILLLVPAGPIVDAVIRDIKPYLGANDIIMDCGNSHFTDTAMRSGKLKEDNIHFAGTGISGGETGARFGPSIMPGGDKTVYEQLAPMLESIAAKANGSPCVAYMGNGAAGHYVKMVHNGIEYALMQLIAETYHLLKKYAGYTNDELHQLFSTWNSGRLHSFLVEITAAVFTQPDNNSNEKLIDKIADTAHQKGTGAWMSQDAMNVLAPIPVIDAAVSQRILSSMKKERVAAGVNTTELTISKNVNKEAFASLMEEALFTSFIITYAQGLAMMQNASALYTYETDIATVASIWRGGCIIRAGILEDITTAYRKEPELKNIMTSEMFAGTLQKQITAVKTVLKTAIDSGIPVPAYSACYNYYESYHSAWLPANLIQAQRDFFGAHTYERTDSEGTFHTTWNQTIQ